MLDRDHKLYDCSNLSNNEVVSWIDNGPSLQLVNSVKGFGKYLSEDLKNAKIVIKGKEKKRDESISTSQIRQIFAKMKAVEARGGFVERRAEGVFENSRTSIELLMLKPLMAYARSRHRTVGMLRLVERLNWAIDEVLKADNVKLKQQRFKNFCKLFEAILAYHRAYGGR